MSDVNLKSIVGMNIKSIRKSRKMTQPELAKAIGKHESSIRKYEKGLTDIPNEVIVKIAEVLEVSPNDLLPLDAWDEEFNPNEKLVNEVKLIEQIESYFGKESVKLLQQFQELNEVGKEKLLSDLEDMTLLPKYLK